MLASFMTTANLFRGLLCETKGLPIRSTGILISRTWKESFQLIVERQVDERWKLIRVYLAVQSSFRRNPGKSVLTNLKIGAACLHKISCFPFGWIELFRSDGKLMRGRWVNRSVNSILKSKSLYQQKPQSCICIQYIIHFILRFHNMILRKLYNRVKASLQRYMIKSFSCSL